MARYQCDERGFVHDEAEGCDAEGFAPGRPWSEVPEDRACPDGAVREKPRFEKLDE